MVERIKNKFKEINKEQIIYLLLIFFSTFFFGLLYVNRYVTDVSGWNMYCAELHHMGKMPYRDFYYYVPPAYLLKLEVIWYMVGKNMLWLRVIGLAERALIFCLLYKVLVRVTKPLNAFLATYAAFLVIMNSSFDGFGDYTQFCRLFVMLASLSAIGYFDHKERRYSMLYLVITFFWVAQAIMTKQSLGIVLLAALMLFYIIYILCRHVAECPQILCGSLAGLGTGLLPWLIWLKVNHAYDQFVDQVFSSAMGAKGLSTSSTVSDSVIVKILLGIFEWKYLLIGILVFVVFLYIDYDWRHKWHKQVKILCICTAGLLCLLYLAPALRNMGELSLYLSQNKSIVFWLIVMFTLSFFITKAEIGEMKDALLYAFCFSGSWIVVSFLTEKEINIISETWSISDILKTVGQISIMIEMVFCARYVLLGIRKKMNETDWIFFCILAVGLSTAVAALLGTGSLSFGSGAVQFVVIPVLLVQLLNLCDRHIKGAWGKSLPAISTAAVFCLSTLLIMCQKIDTPYDWWGWSNIAITDDASYKVENKMYEGMRVSKYAKTILEEIDKLIEANSNEEDFVFIFPYSVIYRMQTGRYEAPTFTPVYFFDVCPDEYALSDLEIIRENLPEIIVWKELGEDCWTTHEKLFRSGNRLGQREIQEWFEDVKASSYELIGEIGNQSVWHLIDGSSVNYTYFADAEDLLSDRNEVSDNVIRLKYVDSLANICLPVVVSGMAVCLVCGAMWPVLLATITYFILFLNAKPIVVLLYIFPLMASLAAKDISIRKKVFMSLLMGSQVLFFFMSWHTVWIQMHIEIWVLIIALILEFMAILYGVKRIFIKLKETGKKISKGSIVKLCCYMAMILATLLVYSINSYVIKLNDGYEEEDMQTMQEIYTWVYRLRHDNIEEELAELSLLGSSGENLSAFCEACELAGEEFPEKEITFKSTRLRQLSGENIFVRISGNDIALWVQADKESGNSGHALSGNNHIFFLSSPEMEAVLNPVQKLENDYILLEALRDNMAGYLCSKEVQTSILSVQDQGKLTALGSDGVNISSLYEAMPESRERLEWIPEFESELLRDCTEDHVYFRLSGTALTVWVQPQGAVVGNSGHALSSYDGRTYCVSMDINLQ